jgi:hypothetical protein
MCLYEFTERAVVGFFHVWRKTAGWQFIHAQMKSDTFTTFSMFVASGIGTGAIDL